MGKLKPGQVRHQITLDETSEISEDLESYAKKRGLSVAQANRCILADWSDACRGRPNPFALALGGTVQMPTPAQTAQQQGEPVETEEDRERREAALEASRQFM